jgi:Lrp/AsnC family leucine-responsive transcriptional regulator
VLVNRVRSNNKQLDAVDVAILRALGEDARMSIADLARTVALSAPSVAERVRRLEECGIVEGYEARVSPARLGLPLAAYLRVRPMPGQLRKVAELLAGLPAIVECDRVTGEDCFIAKAHVRSVAELEQVIDKLLGHAMTNTSIVQSTPIPRRLPPLPAADEDRRKRRRGR